ncbi:MAG: restriction endonuclease subunit S [Lachnospira sp.]|nr:restriction endonuclease subunit S [Lachnospira sp.]
MTAQELKNAILMRAVQGKLVPQDPNDEPASVLLERIRAEKEQLMKEKKIKKQPISVIYRDPSDNQHYEKIGKVVKCIEDEIPFEIPESWEWCRLSTLFTMQAGKNIQASQIFDDYAEEHPYLCYGGNGIRGYVAEYNREGQFPLIGRQGALCGNIKYASGKFYATEHAVVVSTYSHTHINWACMFLDALNLNQYATATAQPGLAVSKIITVLIPVPPSKEQERIVTKIESFDEPIADYEIVNTQLKSLNATINENIKKSILQYAIQGKLVPQDPTDEPASVLLERIRAEKDQMIKDGKIKRDKNESYIYRGSDNSYYFSFKGENVCIDSELPFEIPDSWCWVTLSSICIYIQRGKSPKYSEIEKIPVIAQKCNQWSGFDINKAKFIDPESLEKYDKERFLCDGDLLWNSTGLGTVGRMAIYENSKNPYGIAVADSHVSVIRTMEHFANYNYLFYWFTSPAVQSVIESKTEGSTKQKELYLQIIKDYIVPLPPLNEQQRIVDRIKQYLSVGF